MSTILPPNEFHNRINSWQSCLPNELSDLFYCIGNSIEQPTGVYRLNNYFELGEDAIQQIMELHSGPVQLIKCFRVYMGCEMKSCFSGGQSKPMFAPIFSIVTTLNEEFHYDLTYNSDPMSLVEISSAVTALFRQHWTELSDPELAKAFSGATVRDITKIDLMGNPNDFRERRVCHYDFFDEDVDSIYQYLLETISNGYTPAIRMYMGSGLTVRMSHPFSYRPIINVSVPDVPTEDDPPAGQDYDRSRPCPPFCPEE